MANFITSIRLICAAALLFCPVLSLSFYVLYITAGITDMTDGTVARITNTVSEFGARLDTAADLMFVIVCLIKLIPALDIPMWLYIWIAVIALIKFINIVFGYIICKRFIAVHSVINKITGALLFVLPLTLQVIDLKNSAVIACAVATFAAVHEGYCLRTGRVK